MKLNKKNTMKEILNMPGMKEYFGIFFPKLLLNYVTEENREKSIEEIEQIVKMSWGAPFLGDAFMTAAKRVREIMDEKKYSFVPLWKECDDYMPMSRNDEESVFLMITKNRYSEKKPAVVICPGGGYELLSFEEEGIKMAERMEELGYIPFVLNYRVKPNYYPIPQLDLAIAVKYVKANAEQYGIDKDRIMLMGSSAGGHLCASFTAYYKEIEKFLMDKLWILNQKLAEKYQNISLKPDMLCLNYSVISFDKYGHEESFVALTNRAEELRDKLSIEKNVNEEFPKTYLWACEDDEQVPVNNTLELGKALDILQIPHKMRIFPTGGHGCGIGVGTSANGWMEDMVSYMA